MIVQKLGPVTYRIQVDSETNLIWKRHIDQIRQAITAPRMKLVVEPVNQELYTVPPYVVPTPNDDTKSRSILPNITASENIESNTGNSPFKTVASPTVSPPKVPVTDVTSEPRYLKRISKKPSGLIQQM